MDNAQYSSCPGYPFESSNYPEEESGFGDSHVNTLHWRGYDLCSDPQTAYQDLGRAVGGKSEEYYASLAKKVSTSFGSMSTTEKYEFYHIYTKNGFREMLRTGKMPDGSDLEFISEGKYRDHYGIVRHKHGPFWPADYGPLYATPQHINTTPSNPEPLADERLDGK